MAGENNFTENNLDDIYGAVNFITDLMDNHLAPSDPQACEVFHKVNDLLDEAWCELRNYLYPEEG